MKKVLSIKFSVLSLPKAKGFTMVEMLIYMGLLMSFIAVLAALFGSAIDIQFNSQASTGVANDATYILNRMVYDIHRAESLTTPDDQGDSSSSLVLEIEGETYTYALDGDGNLLYTTDSGTFNLNSYASRISEMTFTNVSNIGSTEDTLQLDINVVSTINQPQGVEEQQIETTVGLRRQ